MQSYLYISFLLILISSCGQSGIQAVGKEDTFPATALNLVESSTQASGAGNMLKDRFDPPTGYTRVLAAEESFAAYLRRLPLKEVDEVVHYYDGTEKPNRGVYVAVVDLPIGTRDLHQCADAVMRLRAEYLFAKKEYEAIHFNFTNGFRVEYTEWIKGKRIRVSGNRVSWEQREAPSESYANFWDYLETIFMYAGTLSLSKELKTVEKEEMKPGDVFIQGGSPGHAVIVVDMALNSSTGKKVFMLAQSYMPAQEIQILANPSDSVLSPWYELDFGNELRTPEWSFTRHNLKRFED